MNTIRTERPHAGGTGASLAPALLVASLGWLAACSSGGADEATGTGSPVVTRGVLSNANGPQVNDRPLLLDGSAVRMNGESADVSALRPGMRVTVASEQGVATQVVYEEDVKGPLDVVLPDGTLSVMGQTVRLLPGTVLDDVNVEGLRAGDVLEVSGLRLADGTIEANYVEGKSGAPNAYSVRGPVRELDTVERVFRIGGLLVNYLTAELDDAVTVREGAEVEVKQEALDYEPGSLFLVATKVERGDEDAPASLSPPVTPGAGGASAPGQGDGGLAGNVADIEYEIDGVVTRTLADGSFGLGSLDVEIDTNTRFRDGSAADLVVDRRVEVEGHLDARGVLLARDVEFDDGDDSTPHHDDRPGDRRDDDGDDRDNDDGDDGDSDARIEVEGTATAIDAAAGTLDIGGMHVVTAPTTRFENARDERIDRESFFALLIPGRTVVKARWDGAGGSGTAPREIEIEN